MNRPFLLIGAGGTGSYLFPPLVKLLDGYYAHRDDSYTLSVIDGKAVDASKLERQLFLDRSVGHNKATALVEQYDANPKMIIAIPSYLDKTNIRAIRENSVILIAADNFPVRARIERFASKMKNITVINGGNEMSDGSLQVWIRRNSQNLTPTLSQGHPEILRDDKDDPAELSCEQIAELPSGQQTIIANLMSATAMLNATRKLLEWEQSLRRNRISDAAVNALRSTKIGEEVFFDLNTWAMRATTRPTEEQPAT